MHYLKETLEYITTNELKCQNIFDFLNEINSNNSHEESFHNFETIWKKKLIEEDQNFALAYNSGLWLPLLPSPQTISKQLTWNDFLLKYFANFISSRTVVSGQDFSLSRTPPLNFEELLKLEFWKSLYDLYGSSVLGFIFNKCLIIFLIKDHFYLLISNPDSLLHMKIMEYTKNFKLRQLKVRTRTTYRNATLAVKGNQLIINQGFRNRYEPNPVSVTAAERVTSETPPSIDPKEVSKSTDRKKRKRKSDQDPITMKRLKPSVEPASINVKPNPTAKRKLQNTEDSVPLSNKRLKCPKTVANDSESNTEKAQNSTPFRRWIAPNPTMLQKIHNHRLTLKKEISQSNGQPISNSVSKELYPVFVNIVNDKYFKRKEKNISKELITVEIKENQPVLGKRLEGLRIPELLLKDSNGQTKSMVKITIYTMCEKLGKEMGLRVKPRKRHKKTRKIKLVENQLTTDDISFSPKINSPVLTNANLPAASKIVIHKWMPFSDTFPIQTGLFLYNQKTSCHFSPKSTFGKILPTSGDLPSKVESLLNLIMDTKVHEPGVLNQLASKELGNKIFTIQSCGGLGELSSILKTMVQFHTRVRNVTQLVRSCAIRWIGNGKKNKVKTIKLKPKKLQSCLDLIKNKESKSSTIFSLPVNNQIDSEMETDTPVTNYQSKSDGSSIANFPCEQPYKCTNSSIVHSLTPSSDNENLQFGSGSSLDKSAHNLSITILQSPSNKIIQNKRKIVKQKLRDQTDILPCHILSTISQILVLSGAVGLLGSNYNRRRFLKFIRKAAFIGGINATLHLGELLAALKPLHCKWLLGVTDITMKYHIFAKTTLWLLTQYVFPIVKLGFYVTETSSSRFQARFFLKQVWKSLTDRVIDGYFKENKLNKTESFPHCRLRFIPKKDNLRPIISDGSQKLLSLSEKENILLLLHYLNSKISPHGSIDDTVLRIRWKQFLQEWRQQNFPKLYYVRADIKDAFPSVNIDKLCSILRELVDENKLGEWNTNSYFVLNRYRSRMRRSLRHSDTWNASIGTWPAIVMDSRINCPKFDVTKVLDHLIKILKSKSTIRIGKQRLEFSNGLPQGSFFSHLLCNIYYGYMERELFSSNLNAKGEFFVRSVDDYFYVSPKPHNVNLVFHKLKKGVPDSNCWINHAKSMTNIYISSDEMVTSNIWVPFCGWRFCITNGHISRNFESYAGQDICSTLTFRMTSQSPINFIHKRMGLLTALRLTPILLDPNINCRRRIMLSLFEGSLMMAFRFYAICRVLFINLKYLSDPKISIQLVKSIKRFARCLNRKIVNHKTLLYPPTEEPICTYANSVTMMQVHSSIEENEVHFLVFHAFLLKFNLHYEVFKERLIPAIRKMKRRKGIALGTATTDYLLSTVGNKLPEHFQAIKI